MNTFRGCFVKHPADPGTKRQEIWETPKWHSKVRCFFFFVLGEIFKKLFYIDKLSRSEQQRHISDFEAATQHNDSCYGHSKGRRVKKNKGEKKCLLGSCLHMFGIAFADTSAAWLPLHRRESVQQRPPRPHCSHRHWPPALATQDNPHQWLPLSVL